MRPAEDAAREIAGAIYVAMHSDQTWAVMAWNDMGGSEPTEERALLELAALNLIRARDAEVAAKAWGEGFATGQSRAMRHMSDEPLLPLSAPNPYEREAGESGADAAK